MSRLWAGRWPAEDGGPERVQAPPAGAGLGIRSGERLKLSAARDTYAATMVVLRDPGEAYVLRHSLGRRPLRDPTHAWVERIDPATLRPLARSPDLAAGPFWPGGLVAHGNGSLHVVYGRYAHRLSAELELLGSFELPAPRPYNSLVVLADGTLAMKDLDLDLRTPARVTLLDPDTLARRASDFELPEPAIARLAADGNTLYVVGASTVWRCAWDGQKLELDEHWRLRYHGGAGHGYGWDPVLAGGHAWFLDNGEHDYVTTMRGAGRARTPARLVRASLADAADHEAVEVCGAPGGAVTNPPLYDPGRRIAVAHDAGNGVVVGFRFDGRLEPLWRRELNHAAHMLQFPDTGELVVGDFHGPRALETRLGRSVARGSSALARFAIMRSVLARGAREDVVVLDIETGAERARASVGTMFQSVLFPAPGFGRDLYWCTFGSLARLAVA